MIVVSACLAGKNCRYNGKASTSEKIVKLVKEGKAIKVCPEILGGLKTPRPPTEIQNKMIITKEGIDLTKQFVLGAKTALKIAKENGCTQAILKSKSPSCGSIKIYDGTFSGKLIAGEGIFCTLLKKNQIKIISEKEFESEL